MIHFLYKYHLNRQRYRKVPKFNEWIHRTIRKFLTIRLIRYYKYLSMKSLRTNIKSNVVISLTTIPSRIEYVHLAIKSVLYQTTPPQKVVLWLGKDYFPKGAEDLPRSLIELLPFGLEIKFCKDIKAHTKYFYSFKEYIDKQVITIDDDIIYPKDLIEVLLKTSQKYPKCVVANRVRKMIADNNGFKPYREWTINPPNSNLPSHSLFATGVSGVLYKPKYFVESIFDAQGIEKTKCIGDDVWLKANQIKSGLEVVKTDYYNWAFIEIEDSQRESLFRTNVMRNDNDRQIEQVFTYFNLGPKSIEKKNK